LLWFSVFCTIRTPFKIEGYTVNIRAEDFITIIMAIYLLYAFIKKQFKLKLVDKIIIAYIVYNAIVLVINCKLGNNTPMYYIILLKEVQYFVYFMFFRSAIKQKGDSNFILQIFIYCSLINIVWGIYQVLNKSVSFYGISCMSSQYAAHSGGVFFIITLLMLFSYNKKNDLLYLLLAIISGVLTCFVVARIFIIALIFATGLYCLYDLYLLIKGEKNKKTWILYGVTLLGVIIFLLNFDLFSDNIYIEKVLARFSRINKGGSIRFNKWISYLKTSELSGIIWGNGKGFSQNLRNSGFKLATDSQYVCYILECGLIGTLVWVWILFEVSLKHFFKKQFNLETVMLCIIVASYLLIGVTIEVFQTVLQASLFWCLVGTLYRYNELNQEPERLMIGAGEKKDEIVET